MTGVPSISPPVMIRVTIRTYPDHPDDQPMVEAIEEALRPYIGKGETMDIEVVSP